MIDAGAEAGAQAGTGGRRYWLWVTGPDYYLDEDGSELPELDPAWKVPPYEWWTCHKETQEGDLVLLYRTRPRMDVAYLIETRSAAYPLRKDQVPPGKKWKFGCDFQSIEKFPRPLRLADMRGDPVLGDWGPLNANFRQKVYEVPPDVWNRLLGLLSRLGAQRFRADDADASVKAGAKKEPTGARASSRRRRHPGGQRGDRRSR